MLSDQIRSDEIGLKGDEVVAIDVEECGFDFVVQVFEQEVIAALDEAKVEVVGCLDHIAIPLDKSLRCRGQPQAGSAAVEVEHSRSASPVTRAG